MFLINPICWKEEEAGKEELWAGSRLAVGDLGPSGRDQHQSRDQEAEQQGFVMGAPERPFTRLGALQLPYGAGGGAA